MKGYPDHQITYFNNELDRSRYVHQETLTTDRKWMFPTAAEVGGSVGERNSL